MSYFNISFNRDLFSDLLSKVYNLESLYQAFHQTLLYIKSHHDTKLLEDDNFYLKIFKYRYNDKTYVDPRIYMIELCVGTTTYKEILKELAKKWYAFEKLYLFSRVGDLEIVEFLTKTHIFSKEDYNWAMGNAATGGHMDIVKLILFKGATDYDWAMKKAAVKGYIDIVKLMLEKGSTDYDGAMFWAAGEGHMEIVKLMLSLGADNYGRAMDNAAEEGHTDIVNLLIQEKEKRKNEIKN